MLVLEVLEKSETKVEDEILGEWQPSAFKRHQYTYKTTCDIHINIHCVYPCIVTELLLNIYAVPFHSKICTISKHK